MREKDFWLAFAVFPGIGPKKFISLLETFKTAAQAWNAGEAELKVVLGQALTEKLLRFRETFSSENYLHLLEKKNVWFVTLADKEYPVLLHDIDNPPFVLFGKGNKDIFYSSGGVPINRDEVEKVQLQNSRLAHDRSNTNLVGIVGTRKITDYGTQVTEMITRTLVQRGFVIVSGLALGVDAVAHQTTINNHGKTIAVLGCGVDCCYPSSNERIYHQIIESGGAVISEFALSMTPNVGSFPSRNRIIAGMSTATIVTEGAEDSGSLITAEDALLFGRKVFAVPGPITSTLSKGPLKLLQKGAVMVTSAEDIIKELGGASSRLTTGGLTKKVQGESKDEQKIIDLLENESLHFDELVKRLGENAKELGSILSVMEIKGYVSRSSTGMISLAQ